MWMCPFNSKCTGLFVHTHKCRASGLPTCLWRCYNVDILFISPGDLMSLLYKLFNYLLPALTALSRLPCRFFSVHVLSIRPCCRWNKYPFLSAFSKLRKSAISYVMPVDPHGIARLPLDGFSWTFIFEYFSRICRENPSLIGILQEWRVFHIFTYVHLW
jgi:hypothetical protein